MKTPHGNTGRIHSQETRDKIGKAHSGKNSYMYGNTLSKQTIERRSISRAMNNEVALKLEFVQHRKICNVCIIEKSIGQFTNKTNPSKYGTKTLPACKRCTSIQAKIYKDRKKALQQNKL